MIATVISVQQNVTLQGRSGGSYTIHLFNFQPDPYQGQPKKPGERKVFTDNRDYPELAGKVAALVAGQRVELSFDTSQYRNLIDAKVIGEAQSQYQQQQAQQMQGVAAGQQQASSPQQQ